MTATPPQARVPLTPLRIVIATIGVLVMLFAGGCSMYFLWILSYFSTAYAEALLVVGIYGVPGLLAGLAIFLLAVRWRRGKMVPPE